MKLTVKPCIIPMKVIILEANIRKDRNMPKAGDSFIAILKRPHVGWGTHRHTGTRKLINGEGYLHIPAYIARKFDITNIHGIGNRDYTCNSADGYLKNSALIASGGTDRLSKYAKNLQGKGDLKILGGWFNHINAQVGDRIEVKFVTPTEILLSKISR
ncbi:hypothetical protein [Arcticibacter pallidicorallinus]|uniref:hypothetical protein n=1 Tax=Arcticibacter pallidicorallinus TaxID=1259464 RepID=UPI001C639B13|nr:hypothetical protein [Arcticibacter pallidicorallinus]